MAKGESVVNGTVERVVAEKGFGFIKGEDDESYFFHRSEVVPPLRFELMRQGTRVAFVATESPKGLRAGAVRSL